MITCIEFLQRHRNKVIGACYGALLLFVLVGFTVDTSHAHSWVEKHIPAFWAIFGFCVTFGLVVFCSWLGKSGVQARPDYYGETPSTRDGEE